MAHSAAYYTSLAHKYMCFNTYMHPTAAYSFFFMFVLWFASSGIRLPGPGGAAAARNGFTLRSPRVGYRLPTSGAPNQF